MTGFTSIQCEKLYSRVRDVFIITIGYDIAVVLFALPTFIAGLLIKLILLEKQTDEKNCQ